MTRLKTPSISVHLLPLLDIVFILLAFFLILPQGVYEKHTTYMAKKADPSSFKALNPSKYVFFWFYQDFFEVEYEELNFRKNGFVKRKYRFSYQGEGSKGGPPKGFLEIVNRARSQLKSMYPKEEICLVYQYSIESKSSLFWEKLGFFAGFAKRNQFPYTIVWKK